MPPIKIHTNSPINAAKAEGITPKTAAPSADEGGDLGTTQAGDNSPLIQNEIHAPLHTTPTRTTDLDNNNPPPPQPGAVPFPQPTQMAAPGSYAPPAPAPTQAARLPGSGGGGEGQDTYSTQPPPQLGISLVGSTAPHTYRGTSTATAPPSTGATTTAAVPSTGSSTGSRKVGYGTTGNYVGVGGGQVEYPPPAGGYQQRGDFNANASGSYQDGNNDEEGVWNSAVKWAQAAGGKLSAAESEVWRRINKE